MRKKLMIKLLENYQIEHPGNTSSSICYACKWSWQISTGQLTYLLWAYARLFFPFEKPRFPTMWFHSKRNVRRHLLAYLGLGKCIACFIWECSMTSTRQFIRWYLMTSQYLIGVMPSSGITSLLWQVSLGLLLVPECSAWRAQGRLSSDPVFFYL